MARTYYVDIPETDNIDCELDGMVELVESDDNPVCTAVTAGSTTVFSIVAGVYTITATGIGGDSNADGAMIRIKGSVDATGLIDNDGVYTVADGNISADAISVVEPVVACTSVSEVVRFEEYATFILHPTKRTGQMLIFIKAAAALATFDVSVKPGGFWASKLELVEPVYQGTGVADKMYLLQIETAPYLQTEEEDLPVDGDTANDIDKKGTILLRIFPGTADDPLLVDEIDVGYIMIA